MSQVFQNSDPNTSKWKPCPLNIVPFRLPLPLRIHSSDIYRQVFTHTSALTDDVGRYGEGLLLRDHPHFEQWELEGDAGELEERRGREEEGELKLTRRLSLSLSFLSNAALYYEISLLLAARYPSLREGGITVRSSSAAVYRSSVELC